tara:strand:- start:5638 stop:6249 length:612 start_codon:yes stop_codon:yes gene_type:complete
MKVVILDYGSGNVGSLSNILDILNFKYVISNDDIDIESATHFILPGVGAFSTVMEKINSSLNTKLLMKKIKSDYTPILGICVGMQVMADFGYENKKDIGLGLISGEVKKIDTKEVLPHVGWNNINIINENDILNNIEDCSDFYFVHKYCFYPESESSIVTTTDYGETSFASIIADNNILGVQFHPEKSQDFGKLLIKNFIKKF